MYCPGGNATDPIWRVLAPSHGISSWTPLKPNHSNPNPKPLANQLWCIDFLTLPTPLIIPHRLLAFLESLMPLKNWCSIRARCSKSSRFHLHVLVYDDPLALLLAGGTSCLCILYHNSMGFGTSNSWSCHILLGDWLEESFHTWCHMEYISFQYFLINYWSKADRLWWVFWGNSLKRSIQISWSWCFAL